MVLKQYGIFLTSIFLAFFISNNVVTSRNIAFVIDDTASMGLEIDQIKNNIQSTLKDIIESDVYNIDDFIIITFNDDEILDKKKLRFVIDSNKEVIKTRARSKNVDELYASIEKIIVSGGGRCPEPVLSGIERALEECSPNSYIYVFTDASPSDFKKEEAIITLAQNKSIQINFLLTGKCSQSDIYDVYERLANESSGEIFRLRKADVNQMMQFLKYSMKELKSNIIRDKIGGDQNFTFTADDVDEVYIAVNGYRPKETVNIKVSDPSGYEAIATTVVETNNTKIYSIRNPDMGTYMLNVNSASEGTVSVVGLVDGIEQQR